jgi:hypothetical protein
MKIKNRSILTDVRRGVGGRRDLTHPNNTNGSTTEASTISQEVETMTSDSVMISRLRVAIGITVAIIYRLTLMLTGVYKTCSLIDRLDHPDFRRRRGNEGRPGDRIASRHHINNRCFSRRSIFSSPCINNLHTSNL